MGGKIEKIDLNKLQEREKSFAVFLTGGNSGNNIQTSSRLQAIHNLLLPLATAINQIADKLNALEISSEVNENFAQSSTPNAGSIATFSTPLLKDLPGIMEILDKNNNVTQSSASNADGADTLVNINKPIASDGTTFAAKYLESIKDEQEVFQDDLDKQQTKTLEEKSETETKTGTRRRPRK